MKITIVGAGNVGAQCACVLANTDICDEIILLDIKSNLAEGKALDILQASYNNGYKTRIIGVTNDYKSTYDSEIVVITSGLTRKSGISRESLISSNASIVKSVVRNSIIYSPKAKIIIVSNPLDGMTYTAYKTVIEQGHSKYWAAKSILGMAGVLDTARYRTFIAKYLHCMHKNVKAILLGNHDGTMIPLTRYTTVSGIPIVELIKKDKLADIIENTKKGGEEIISLLGLSAWYAPGAYIAEMVETIIMDYKNMLSCCVWLEGEYGLKDVCLGVPIILGRHGVEKIIELNLNKSENQLLKISANNVRNIISVIDKMNLWNY